MSKSNKNNKNHVVFLIDASTSMEDLKNAVQQFFKDQVDSLKKNSKKYKQDVVVSLFYFSSKLSSPEFFRSPLSNIFNINNYSPGGNTSLVNSTSQVIDLVKSVAVADESVVLYVLTDGENNLSGSAIDLSKKINSLPEEWTVTCFVPNSHAAELAYLYGFSKGNVSIWEVSEGGLKDLGVVTAQSIDTYMSLRSTGAKGTNKLFTISAEKLNKTKKVLKELNPSQYHFLPVNKTQKIKDFVESWTGEAYRVGSAYYQFTKPETIQSGKQICVQDKLDGRVYSGTNARSLLGLPDYGVKVDPAAHPKYTIFVQSTSTNRNLVPGTSLIVIR